MSFHSPRRRSTGLLLAVVFLTACGGTGEGGSAAVTRDSAGVQIVENAGTGWAEGAGWVVADSPSVSIGGQAGDPAYDLNQVAGVALLGNGRIAVAVGGAFQLRIYDPAGAHLASSGGQGSGPGEYQGMAGLWRMPGDSLLVSDLLVRRLTVVDDSGRVGRTFSLGGETGFAMPTNGRMSLAIPVGTFGDGSVLGAIQGFSLSEQREGVFRDTVAYVRYGPDGALADTVTRLPGIEMESVTMTIGPQSFSAPSPVPLGRATMITPAGDRVLLTTNDSWEIRVLRPDGATERLIRLRFAPRTLTPEQVAAHRQETRDQIENMPMLRGVPEPIRKQMTDRVDQAKYPETMPYITAIFPAPDGSIWVHEQGTPGDERQTMAVLDSTGAFLGRLRLPDRFRLMSVGTDRIAGVWRDADDVEYAWVLPLRR